MFGWTGMLWQNKLLIDSSMTSMLPYYQLFSSDELASLDSYKRL